MTPDGSLLDALFEHAPVGLAILDRDVRYVRINRRLADINGLPVADHLGRGVDEVLGELGGGLREAVQRVLVTGEPVHEIRISGPTPADPEAHRDFVASYVPVGDATVLAIVAEETAERRAAEAATAAASQLDAVYSATPVGLAFWSPDLRFVRVNEALAEINGRPVADHIGRSLEEVLGERAAEIEGYLREAMATGEPVERSIEAGGGHYEVSYYPVTGRSGELLGVGGMVRDVSERFAAEAERAQLLKQALTARAHAEAAQLRVEEALRTAESARARTEFLAEAGRRLASSMDIGVTLQRVADLAVPRVAEWCVMTLKTDAGLENVAVAHADPARRRRVLEFGERYPPDPEERTGVAEVIRTGEMQVINGIPDEMLVLAARDDEHLAMLRELGMRAALIAPLATPQRALGALTLIRGTGHPPFSEEDVALARALAARAALHINNARLYSERTHIARTLQAALLPRRLPMIPGIELAASYEAAGDQNVVGGDFYDVFAAGEGAWTALIGDVSGKGPEAAAVTSLARHTLRTVLSSGLDLAAGLRTLNDALLEQVPDRFCTVAAVRVVPDGSGADLVVALGGHPEPLIRRATGEVEPLRATGPLIGALPHVAFDTVRARLGDGDMLLLYTDGLIEPRGRPAGFGERWLPGILAQEGAQGPEALLAELQRCVRELQGGVARDDVAMLALRRAR